MTIADVREQLSSLDDTELQSRLDLYQGLASPGVRDEIMITLLEDELFTRAVV